MMLTAVVAGAQIRDAVGNEYGRPQDVAGEQRTVFTSHADAAFDVCFENLLTGCTLLPSNAFHQHNPYHQPLSPLPLQEACR